MPRSVKPHTWKPEGIFRRRSSGKIALRWSLNARADASIVSDWSSRTKFPSISSKPLLLCFFKNCQRVNSVVRKDLRDLFEAKCMVPPDINGTFPAEPIEKIALSWLARGIPSSLALIRRTIATQSRTSTRRTSSTHSTYRSRASCGKLAC
jgi:hypothetical protein